MTRLAYRALIARVSRAAHGFASTAWGVRALLVSAFLAPCGWLTVVLTPERSRRRRVAAAFTRLAMRLSGVRPSIRHTAVELRRAAREHILGQIHEPDLEQGSIRTTP